MSATTAPRSSRPAGPSPRGDALAGLGRLVRFGLRRDRVRIPAWAVGVAGLVGYMAVAIPVAYPDAEALQSRADVMKDPSGAMLTGPGYGLESYTFGAMVANELLGMVAVATALMSIFLVVRHTRAEEESGRAELVRAGTVGRYAPLTAALVVVTVANLAVGAALVGALTANDLALTDSLAIGAGAAAVGMVFAGVAAVTAQLADHARSASGAAGAVLGLAYVLRGVGDAQERGGSALSWSSPIGWVQQMRAYVDLRWWPVLLAVALAVALVAVAFWLVTRRDVGAGLVPSRGGRPEASRALVVPAGLAVRTDRAAVVGWAVGLGVFGVLTGSMGQAIVDSFAEQPQLAQVFGGLGEGDVLRAALAAFLGFFAMAVAVQVVVATGRLRRDEEAGRTAAVLVAGVSRFRWLTSSLAVTAGGGAALLVVSGATLGLGAGMSVGDLGLVVDFALASLAYLPLVLAFLGLAVLAYGVGRGVWVVWVLLVASIVVGLYGPILNLPQEVLDVAPFGLVPQVPAAGLDVGPLLGQGAAALALGAAGAWCLRRRDLRG